MAVFSTVKRFLGRIVLHKILHINQAFLAYSSLGIMNRFLELRIQIAYQDESEYGISRDYRIIAIDDSALKLPSSEEIISEFRCFKPNETIGTIEKIFC